jgi:hypothetical protein
MQINKCNTEHKQNQGKKSPDDHLNRCKKNFIDKIQYPFMIKALKKLRMEGMYLDLIKNIYDKP